MIKLVRRSNYVLLEQIEDLVIETAVGRSDHGLAKALSAFWMALTHLRWTRICILRRPTRPLPAV